MISSSSRPDRTFLPHSVLTKVVRPSDQLHLVPLSKLVETELQHTSSRGATDHHTELNSLLDILLPTHLDLRRRGG